MAANSRAMGLSVLCPHRADTACHADLKILVLSLSGRSRYSGQAIFEMRLNQYLKYYSRCTVDSLVVLLSDSQPAAKDATHVTVLSLWASCTSRICIARRLSYQCDSVS